LLRIEAWESLVVNERSFSEALLVQVLSIEPGAHPGTLEVVLRTEEVVERYSFTPRAVMIADQQAYLFNGEERFEQDYALFPGLSGSIYQLVKDVFFGKSVSLPVMIDDSIPVRQPTSA
jgi:hypothetical protein